MKTEVMQSIESEREYQRKKYPEHNHTVAEFLVIMEKCLNDGKRRYVNGHLTGNREALEEIRQVVAVGVAAMEQHGAPMREPKPKTLAGTDLKESQLIAFQDIVIGRVKELGGEQSLEQMLRGTVVETLRADKISREMVEGFKKWCGDQGNKTERKLDRDEQEVVDAASGEPAPSPMLVCHCGRAGFVRYHFETKSLFWTEYAYEATVATLSSWNEIIKKHSVIESYCFLRLT